MCWQRARKPEQKLERRDAILHAASEMFRETDYDGVSLNGIARRSGMAKSNVYRYFATREEIFLHLLLEGLAPWAKELEAVLAGFPAGAPSGDIAQAFASVTLRHPRFLDLMTKLATSMERNSSEDELVRFKVRMQQLTQPILRELQRLAPGLPPEDAFRLLIWFHALSVGLWPVTQCSPVVERVLSRPELSHMRVDFEAAVTRAFAILVEGVLPRPVVPVETRWMKEPSP